MDIDEESLKDIAEITGGTYFRATDTKSLSAIYQEIDQLEKTKIQVKEYNKKEELYHWFVLALVVCLIGEITLRNTVFKSIP